jgi:hypothetical protein
MKLAFKNKLFGYSEKEVEITLNIGTLEALCKDLKIEFWQIGAYAKNEVFDFRCDLLWHGYITACKDRYEKPKYTKVNAILWNDHMSNEALLEFNEKMKVLFGEITKMSGSKKKVN